MLEFRETYESSFPRRRESRIPNASRIYRKKPNLFRRHSHESGNLEMKSSRNLSEMTETERTGFPLCGNDGDKVAVIVDEQKPVRRCLALAQRERFSKVPAFK